MGVNGTLEYAAKLLEDRRGHLEKYYSGPEEMLVIGTI